MQNHDGQTLSRLSGCFAEHSFASSRLKRPWAAFSALEATHVLDGALVTMVCRLKLN